MSSAAQLLPLVAPKSRQSIAALHTRRTAELIGSDSCLLILDFMGRSRYRIDKSDLSQHDISSSRA